MTVVSLDDAAAGFGHLIDRVLAGEEIVIARDGGQGVRLAPLAEVTDRRLLDPLGGALAVPEEALLEPLPEDLRQAFGRHDVPDDDSLPSPRTADRNP